VTVDEGVVTFVPVVFDPTDRSAGGTQPTRAAAAVMLNNNPKRLTSNNIFTILLLFN
jgi:hypothetical protein